MFMLKKYSRKIDIASETWILSWFDSYIQLTIRLLQEPGWAPDF